MVDKNCIQQVLGCLLKHPQFLSEVDKYSLTLSDFSNRFERLIFAAIDGLYKNGAANINVIDVENYLQFDAAAKKTFESNNGIEYLQDIEEFSDVDNFNYYYNKLKKLNLLRDLSKQGFDTSDFYREDLTTFEAIEVNDKFEQLTCKDIVDSLKKKLLKLESIYEQTEEVQTEKVSDGLDELIESFGTQIDIGPPIQGKIYNKVIDGAQKGALTVRSGGSGTGKTRNAVGDACMLAFPIRFNWETCKWEQVGSSEKVLFIITEQTFVQIRRMIIAYVSGIDEDKFKYGALTQLEKAVLEQTKSLIKRYESNLTIVKMPNPTIELVKVKIRSECLLKSIDHVFFDYIFISPALLNEFRGFNIRNDEALLMFATALKDLAVELNVSLFTGTQVNANADNNTSIRNEGSLAGGRSTINKADNGAIMARPTKEELETLQPIIEMCDKPNLVTDIFKVRSGKWTQVRIWSKIDLGTMRKEDLFITDERLEPLSHFFDEPDYKIINWDDEQEVEIYRVIDELNAGVVDEL